MVQSLPIDAYGPLALPAHVLHDLQADTPCHMLHVAVHHARSGQVRARRPLAHVQEQALQVSWTSYVAGLNMGRPLSARQAGMYAHARTDASTSDNPIPGHKQLQWTR